ncbi:hypothetical protein, partial [Enterococcus faecalis]
FFLIDGLGLAPLLLVQVVPLAVVPHVLDSAPVGTVHFSIILAFLIIYTLFKTRETSSSSRKLRMLVYTFFGIIFLLGLVSVVLGTYGLLNSYNISGNWRINMSSILVVLAGFLLVVLSYVGISKFKMNC